MKPLEYSEVVPVRLEEEEEEETDEIEERKRQQRERERKEKEADGKDKRDEGADDDRDIRNTGDAVAYALDKIKHRIEFRDLLNNLRQHRNWMKYPT